MGRTWSGIGGIRIVEWETKMREPELTQPDLDLESVELVWKPEKSEVDLF